MRIFSWHTKFFVLACLMQVAFLLPFSLPARAQSLFNEPRWPAAATLTPTIVIKDQTAAPLLAQVALTVADTSSDLSVPEVMKLVQTAPIDRQYRDSLTQKISDGVLWYVIPIKNLTAREDWVLDFGTLGTNRSGLAASATVFMDGIEHPITNKIVTQRVSLVIPKGAVSTLLIRLLASDDGALTITPRLMPDEGSSVPWDTISFPVFAAAGFVLAMAGFILGLSLLNRGVILLPLGFYLVWQSVVILAQAHYLTLSLPFNVNLPMLSGGIALLLAMAGTQPVLSIQDNEAADSIAIYMLTIIIVVTLAVVLLLLPPSVLRGVVFGLVLAVGWSVIIIKAGFLRGTGKGVSSGLALAWFIALIGVICQSLSIVLQDFVPFSLAFVSNFAPVPIGILLILSSATLVRLGYVSDKDDAVQKLQRGYAVAKLQQAKEVADQSRLLRIIEREREIMEELRGAEVDRVEEMRLARIAAVEANQAKTAFVAIISHEIRTPMTGIMGMVRLLMDTPLNNEQRSYVGTISDSGEAMLSLLNDILDFSKIEKGSMVLERIPFEIDRLVHGIVLLMSGHAAQKGIKLEADIDKDIAQHVIGDPTRLRQVILNLVSNAIKFTRNGGVTIRIRNYVDKDPTDTRNLIHFAVEDTGVGIPEEAQSHVFSAFRQADSSINRKFGGTGLGLAICKNLIEAMNSHISLSSREGLGTTFYFTLDLPIASEDDLRIAAGETVQAGRIGGNVRPLHVLVADDNEINRKVMDGLLRRDGHTVVLATNGLEAIQKVQTEKFDMVFMDIEMPDMDGVTAIRAIRNLPFARVAQLPIVAVTGNVQEEDILAYKEAGANEHLAKPIAPDQLRALIFGLAIQTGEHSEEPGSLLYNPEYTAAEYRLDGIEDVDLDDTDSFSEAMLSVPPITLENNTEEKPSNTGEKSETDDSLLNRQMVDDLTRTLGRESVQEMLEGVFLKNDEIISGMHMALARDDRKELAARAHEMKGMCGNFGLQGLADIAKQLEMAAKAEEVDHALLTRLVIGGEIADKNTATKQAVANL